MRLRVYRSEDCAAMAALFYDTVHTINRRDYSPAQLDAWATGTVNLAQWNERFLTSRTLVAEADGVLIGFGNMDAGGYLDMLYVHRDYQRQGVARALCDALEGESQAARFSTHASITARPFFERRGYRTIRAQQVERQGVLLTNFLMEKERSGNA